MISVCVHWKFMCPQEVYVSMGSVCVHGKGMCQCIPDQMSQFQEDIGTRLLPLAIPYLCSIVPCASHPELHFCSSQIPYTSHTSIPSCCIRIPYTTKLINQQNIYLCANPFQCIYPYIDKSIYSDIVGGGKTSKSSSYPHNLIS